MSQSDVTPNPSQIVDAPELAHAGGREASPRSLESLPPYARSLLRIKVPVVVTLAHKKQSISKIVEIGPGTILQFDKSCEHLLELEVNGHEIGAGEAVKVGDKFGLRVVAMKLPDERFTSVNPRRAS